jgi:hypothetical protein
MYVLVQIVKQKATKNDLKYNTQYTIWQTKDDEFYNNV